MDPSDQLPRVSTPKKQNFLTLPQQNAQPCSTQGPLSQTESQHLLASLQPLFLLPSSNRTKVRVSLAFMTQMVSDHTARAG